MLPIPLRSSFSASSALWPVTGHELNGRCVVPGGRLCINDEGHARIQSLHSVSVCDLLERLWLHDESREPVGGLQQLQQLIGLHGRHRGNPPGSSMSGISGKDGLSDSRGPADVPHLQSRSV